MSCNACRERRLRTKGTSEDVVFFSRVKNTGVTQWFVRSPLKVAIKKNLLDKLKWVEYIIITVLSYTKDTFSTR